MIMIINRVTFAKSGLDVMHQLTLAIASAHVSLRRRHSKIAKGKTPQIQTSGIDSAHVLSPRLMIPHARSHSTTPRPAPNNRTNVSSRCPSARTRGPERAAPRRTRLAGPSNPIHHATLPHFLSWPISPPAPAPSSKASRVQRRNCRAQNHPRSRECARPRFLPPPASRPRRSSKSPSSMDRYQRVEKPREETPLGPNEIRITAQGRPRNYITYALALLQVSLRAASSLAFLGPVRWRPFSPWRKKQSRFGGVSPILIVCLGFSAASIPLHRASGIVVAGVVMVSNLNIYCSIPRLLLCACCLLLEATSKYVLVAQCCLFWAALGRNNGFVGSLFRDATSRYLLLRA
jgi:hypothetical protein